MKRVIRCISSVFLSPYSVDCDRCTLFFVDRRTNELIVTRGASHGRRASVIASDIDAALLNDYDPTRPVLSSRSPETGVGMSLQSQSRLEESRQKHSLHGVAIESLHGPNVIISTGMPPMMAEPLTKDDDEGALPFRYVVLVARPTYMCFRELQVILSLFPLIQ